MTIQNNDMSKVIYKSFFPNLFNGVIDSIVKIDTNRFEIITHACYGKKQKDYVLNALIEIGFLNNKENGKIEYQIHTKINTWNCLKTIFCFMDFEYLKYNNL